MENRAAVIAVNVYSEKRVVRVVRDIDGNPLINLDPDTAGVLAGTINNQNWAVRWAYTEDLDAMVAVEGDSAQPHIAVKLDEFYQLIINR